MIPFSKIWKTLKSAGHSWVADDITTQSSALSFYAVFSITPLILIALAIAGFIYGQEASSTQVFKAFEDVIGPEGAVGVKSMVDSASKNADVGLFATIVGVVTLLIGSTKVFGQLQEALNRIWKVHPKPGRGISTYVRQRLLSFSIVLVVSFLLLVSLLLSAILSATGTFLSDNLPGGAALWQIANSGISFGVTVFLFAAIYKILPDVELKWTDVWVGAAITALFFTLGKWLLGLYLGRQGVASSYGVGGSAIVFLLWAYYSSAILLYGAEFAKEYVKSKHRKLTLKKNAEWLLDPIIPKAA